ncbi:cAMP and cAMP-inhibited cGMP 3',5'-cyclic phosphodiesterase 10A-like [Centruroides vittatus]|uniref:cAMP and cAMP-inhibited cGMP 3',5'-cyclic phosphodiesterase 10A-like n=1 Tax=Centruroides vittatus TaxID=120091 RepID=UPI00350F62AF
MKRIVNIKPRIRKELVATEVASWISRNKEIKNELLDTALLEYLQSRPDLVEQHIKRNMKKCRKFLDSRDDSTSRSSPLDNTSVSLKTNLLTLIKQQDLQSALLNVSYVLKAAVNADSVKVSLLDKSIINPNKEYEIFRGRRTIRFYLVSSQVNIITMNRLNKSLPFSTTEQEIATFLINSVNSCLNLYGRNKEQINNENIKQMTALLSDKELTRSIIIRILKQIRETISADRANLYVANDKRDEFIPEYFDFGENYVRSDIKYPLGKGYCGTAALKQMVIKISHSTSDNEILEIMGINPPNVISYPIEVNNEILGVLQLLRFDQTLFTITDEKEMEFFVIYLSFILSITNTHHRIEIKDNLLKVASERLKYHTEVREEELWKLIRNPQLDIAPMDLDNIKFPFNEYSPQQFPKIIIYLLRQLLEEDNFPLDKICHFILTVSRHYRDVPYHNIYHAFNVTHCMYLMLKDVKTEIPKLEIKTLMIASLCHDLDHRGFDNNYLKLIKSPLANLYSVSILEQHHYTITVSLLQDSKSNIFCDLSAEQFKFVLEDLETLILATDLTQFNNNKENLHSLIQNSMFQLSNEEHRRHLKKVMITGCDISSNCKPISILVATVKNLYQEFYTQGDELKKIKIQPTSMMDRSKQNRIPKDQIGFIKYICLPCFELIAHCLPKTEPILLRCEQSLQYWESMNQRGLSISVPLNDIKIF